MILSAVYAVLCIGSIAAQEKLNENEDNVIGEYLVSHQGEESKIRVTKNDDGTFTGQVFWVKNRRDKKGNVRLDTKNPDRSLRDVPCDRIVILKGLKYNAEKNCWDGGKVYDPIRGIRANATCEFVDEGKLKLKGSLMGISQSIIWEKEINSAKK